MLLTLPNSSGQVLSIHELFGNNAVGPDGKRARNGFAALAKYDVNHDGRIDSSDPVFAQLRLWSDVNGDGVAQADELFTLDSFGITQINLNQIQNFKESDSYGNRATNLSTLILKGQPRSIFDLWFAIGGF